MKYAVIIPACLILLSSCYNYKIFPKELRNYSYSGPRMKAYVLNPELKKEYKILRSSKIFDIVSDSLEPDIVKITLHPLGRHFVCGEGAIGSFITLGQVPVVFPDSYDFSFQETTGNSKKDRAFELDISEQLWFWNMFVINKKFDQKAGQILSAKYYGN